MKKSIGLTANISEYRPNLPQTKHLNYFMGTNPVHMANGGDVRAGIPSYPDANVTRGFLPAALGFKEAGDTTEKKSWYDALITVIAGYLGKEKSQEEIEEVAADLINENPEKAKEIVNQAIQEGAIPEIDTKVEDEGIPKFQGSEQGKAIADAFDYAGQGSGQSTGAPTVTPKDTVTDLDDELTEHLRKLNLIGMGGYYGAPPAISQITPGIGPRLETSPGQSSGAPQDTGGITEIKPESKNPLDLNGDGEVNMKDLEYAKNNPLLSWAIPALKKILGIVEDWSPDEPEKIEPKVPEDKIITKEEDRIAPKADEIWPTETKDESTSTDDTDKGGITSIDKGYPGEKFTTTEEATLGRDEQAIFKKTADIASGGIGDAKKKKDVPAWALPLMSAGFAMMASKSPYFMQALGEGGEKALETYTAQKTAEEEKLDKESERKLRESQSKYYETRTQKPDIKIMTDDEGRGVYHRWDDTKQDYVSLNRIAVPSNADITKELETAHTAQMWATYTTEKKQQLIQERRNQYLGIVQSNLSAVEEKGGSLMEKIKTLTDLIESWNPDKKDGGIVTLRR